MDGYLNARDAAARLGISDRQLRKLRADGLIAGQEVAHNAWLYPLTEVERYERERRAPGRPKVNP